MNQRFDWRNKESDSQKARLLHKTYDIFFGDERQTQLVYDVGTVDGLTSLELEELVREFLRGCQSAFDPLEFFQGKHIPGTPMLMRIGGMLVVHPWFQLRERSCPLLQVGPMITDGGQLNKTVINFHREWKQHQM